MKLNDKELELLNSKSGLKILMQQKEINLEKALNQLKGNELIRKKQVEMVELQERVIRKKEKWIIIFEGRDAAGKGGAIQKITAHINPRHFRLIALDKPNEDEKGQWYFQRYVNKFPKPGEMVFFDRSWYNRAMVEPVNGFCTKKKYQRFMEQVNHFEKMIIDSGTRILKFYLNISKKEQKRRFDLLRKTDLLKWRMTSVDEKAQKLWDKYTEYEEKMLEQTNSEHAPWHVIDADEDYPARLKAMEIILNS